MRATAPLIHLVEIRPADLADNPDAHADELPVRHRCPRCGLQKTWWLGSGRWALIHRHDGTWEARRSGRLCPGGSKPRQAPAFPEALAG